MKIVATSDFHGHLPPIPKCDLLLIAGDICPLGDHSLDQQVEWLNTSFADWLDEVPADDVVSVWGNHDWAGMLVPNCLKRLSWENLVNETVIVGGLKIYGSPWTRDFNNWAFNLPEEQLEQLYSRIPACDILLTHGPALGWGDQVEHERVGSPALRDYIVNKQPRLHVFGHVHCDRGFWSANNHRTQLRNVSLVNGSYYPVQYPACLEM